MRKHPLNWAKRHLFPLLCAALLLLCCGAAAEETVYVENEWNFVDGSMDVSHGIPEDAGGVLGRIRERGVLKVATEPYFAPQEFIDPDLEGQEAYVGSDMKFARLIAERMGVELEIVPKDFSDVLSATSTDECDLAISALSFIPSRAQTNTMSKGYYFVDVPSNSSIIIREEQAEEISSIEDLSNRIIVAQQGSLQEALMVEHVYNYREFRRLSTMQDVYEAVMNGEADAGAADIENATNFIRNNPGCGLMLVEEIQFQRESQYAGDRVAAKKGEAELMYFVNGVIDEMLADGRYSKWYEEAQLRANELGL